jgi:hypothetical protein
MFSKYRIAYSYIFLLFLSETILPEYAGACTLNLQTADSVYDKQVFSSTGNHENPETQRHDSSFYKTDSVFSFQSKKGYVPSLLSNFGEQITAPFKFNKKQWLITGAAAGLTVALLHFDNHIDKWATVQKQQHEWVNKSSPVITMFGSTYGTSSVAAFGLVSALFGKQKGVQTSLLATQALITSGAWVQIIKHLTGREDPSASYIYSKKAGGKWWGPFAQYDQDIPIFKSVSSFDAFPSGHTAAAFSIATVFATQYSNTKIVPVLSYSLATLVGISRLTEHAHWASDVFVGGLIGYACGKEVTGQFKKAHQKHGDPGSSKLKERAELSFFQYGNQFGFTLKW